jgi:hypothetical protein
MQTPKIKIGLTEIRHTLGLRSARDTKNAIDIIKEMANEDNNMVVREQGRGIAEYYSVEKMPEHEEMKDCNVSFSVGSTADETNTDFIPIVCLWSDFEKYATDKEHSWSPAIFKDNYRAGTNVIEIPSFLVMDCDNTCPSEMQTTIEMAERELSKFEYLIYTTKSHLKEKPHKTYTDPANERFRIVIPVTRPLPLSDGQLRKVIDGFVTEFFPHSAPKTFDIPASSDKARYFWGNPGIVKKHKGLKMDWMMYLPDETGHLTFGTKRTMDPKSLIPRGTVWTGKSGSVTIDDVRKIGGKSLPVHCNIPGHEDTNASAWLWINRNGNVQFNCSACGITMFEK